MYENVIKVLFIFFVKASALREFIKNHRHYQTTSCKVIIYLYRGCVPLDTGLANAFFSYTLIHGVSTLLRVKPNVISLHCACSRPYNVTFDLWPGSSDPCGVGMLPPGLSKPAAEQRQESRRLGWSSAQHQHHPLFLPVDSSPAWKQRSH